jgi:predicted pyridoxine 5'-phosphate oxidase superfamily flavin-nucleotide-binding protein
MIRDPFHADERAAQRRAGFALSGAPIRSFMPDEHRAFFCGLAYLFVGLADATGAPMATILAGEPGFVESPDAATLRVGVSPDDEDPARSGWRAGARVGLLGLDLSNRRRNRANGVILAAGGEAATIAVEQSFGNCPRYIQRRDPKPATLRARRVERFEGLDDAARELIGRSDTAFIASRSREAITSGGGFDVSHRGGPPGFVRAEGELLSFPDYPGNRYLNTLGNLLGEPRAGLLFVDFERGDVLQLQGRANIDWEDGERTCRFKVERGWRRRSALPIAWTFVDYAPTTLRIDERVEGR